MRLKRTYSSREVAAFTGLSARQLQIWDAGELLPSAVPSHRTARGGHTERRYTPTDVFELLALADLRQRGFTIPALRTVVETLARVFSTSLFDATGGGGPIRLLADNRAIYVQTADGQFYDLLEQPGQPLLVVADERALTEPGKRRVKKRSRRRRKIAER